MFPSPGPADFGFPLDLIQEEFEFGLLSCDLSIFLLCNSKAKLLLSLFTGSVLLLLSPFFPVSAPSAPPVKGDEGLLPLPFSLLHWCPWTKSQVTSNILTSFVCLVCLTTPSPFKTTSGPWTVSHYFRRLQCLWGELTSALLTVVSLPRLF